MTPAKRAQLASFAALAYQSPDSLVIEPEGMELRWLLETETQAVLGVSEDSQVLAFRGTEPPKLADLMTDADCLFSAFAGGLVHRGFLGGLYRAWDALEAALRPGLPLYLTGHSLGGALATLAAATIKRDALPLPVAGVFTCGSPRVGNGAFVDFYAAAGLDVVSERAVHNNDVVTRVPLSALGYRHVGGSVVWIDRDGSVAVDPSAWSRFRDRLCGRVEALFGGEPDVLEVPGISPAVVEILDRIGMRAVRALVAPSAVAALTGAGVPPLLASRIVAWALDRTADGTVFDGLHDHAVARYVAHLNAAALPPA